MTGKKNRETFFHTPSHDSLYDAPL